MAFAHPPNTTDFFGMTSIIGNEPGFANFVDFPELDDHVLACGGDPGVAVLSAEYDLLVAFE